MRTAALHQAIANRNLACIGQSHRSAGPNRGGKSSQTARAMLHNSKSGARRTHDNCYDVS
eukprot:2285686-Pyramimonas_sp.AAC.1